MISNFDKLMRETPHKISQKLYCRCDMCYYQPCCSEMGKLTNRESLCQKGFEIFLNMEYEGDRDV